MKLRESIQRLIAAGAGALGEVERQATLNELADMRSPRVTGYQVYEGYYDGDYTAPLTGRLKKYLEINGFGYVENFCEPIVDALATRLELNSVVAEDPVYSEWVRRVWQRNRLDDLQGVVHTQAPMKGDYYVIVDWNPATGLPRFTMQRPEHVRPVYDEHGELLVVAKVWAEARFAMTNPTGIEVRRLNLYFPERVEKWFTASRLDLGKDVQEAVWQPHQDIRGEAWPIPWVDKRGLPLGCAVLHFRNKPKGRDYGKSELKSVIPQQNLLTKELVDLAEVLDYQGAAQRYATGVDSGTFTSAPGTVWTSKNENARFGQFEPANPAGVLEALEQTLRRVAARSQTPLHQLMTGGQPPTGETLRAANEPLVKKAQDRQTSYGGVWVDGHVLAMKLQELYDPSFNVPADLELTASWESAESSNEKADLEAAEAKHRLGVSRRTLLAELGYDPDEEEEHRRNEADAGATALIDAFNQGRNGRPVAPGTTPIGAPGPDPPAGTSPAAGV